MADAKISALTALAAADVAAADVLPIVDTSAGVTKKVGRNDLIGSWATWTPTVTQSGSVTATVTRAEHLTIAGLVVVCFFDLAITGAGTGGNVITISLPSTMNAANGGFGSGWIADASNTTYEVSWIATSTTAIAGLHSANTNYVGATPNFALASGDSLRGGFIYRPA